MKKIIKKINEYFDVKTFMEGLAIGAVYGFWTGILTIIAYLVWENCK